MGARFRDRRDDLVTLDILQLVDLVLEGFVA